MVCLSQSHFVPLSSLSLVCRGSNRVGNNWSIRVGSDSLVGDLSNISVIVVGVVVDMLGATIGKSNGVGASLGSSAVGRLLSVEGRGRVVISHSIVEVVGGDLSETISQGMSNSMGNNRGSMIDRGSMHYRGSVHYGGSMDHRAVGRGSMHHRGSMY